MMAGGAVPKQDWRHVSVKSRILRTGTRGEPEEEEKHKWTQGATKSNKA
jgi:hypothetical protein